MACDFTASPSLLSVLAPTVNLQGQARTVRVWAYFDVISGTQYLFAANAADESTYAMFCAVTATGQLYIQRSSAIGSTGNAQWCNSTTGVVTAGTWDHYVFTFTNTFAASGATNILMYKNGVQVADAGAPGTGVGSELSMLGRWMAGGHNNIVGGRAFNGRMEGLRLDNRVWSPAEILADYQGTAPETSARLWEPNLNTNGTTDLAGLQTATATSLSFTNAYPRPGLQAWFRADTVTGNPISAIADRSGNGCDLAQATSGNRPALYSGSDFPAPLVQNTDYDSAAGAEKHTCLDKATGSGPTFSSRKMTIYIVAGSVLGGADNSPHNEQTLLSIGDPATGATGIFDFSITPPGDIAIRRTKATTQTLTSGVYMTANPRVYAIRCNATNVTLFNELRSETLTALTNDTATGLRLGATPGTIDNAWMGDWAEVRIYSRDDTDAQVQAEVAQLQAAYALSRPSKTLIVEGSSSATGYRSTDCRGLMRPLYTIDNAMLIHNIATGGHSFTEFDAGVPSISAIANANAIDTYILAWLGAIDLSAVADNGAAVYAELTDWLTAVREYEPLNLYLKKIILTTILVSGADTDREAGRLAYNALMRSTINVRLADVASIPRFVPTANDGAALTAISSGDDYGDFQHLNDDGYEGTRETFRNAVRRAIGGIVRTGRVERIDRLQRV